MATPMTPKHVTS